MTPNDKPMWERSIEEHARHRGYARTPEADVDFETMWYACGQDYETFHRALDDLTNAYGLNLVRPIPLAKREPPPPLKDADGRELPNPFATGNRRDQRALLKADPELAEHLRNLAERPYEYTLELEAAERERQAINKANAEYDATAHKEQNPFVSDNHTAQTQFVKRCDGEATLEARAKKETYMREARPVDFGGLFAHEVQKQNREVINQVAHDGDRKLLRIIQAGQERRRVIDLAAHQKAEAQREQDARDFERQRQAHEDAMKGVQRLPDGRTITMPGRQRA